MIFTNRSDADKRFIQTKLSAKKDCKIINPKLLFKASRKNVDSSPSGVYNDFSRGFH